MREGNASRIAVGKPRAGSALPEGGKICGHLCTAHGSRVVSGVYLKFWYSNTYIVRKNQDELKALISSQSNIIGISETGWNESRGWSAGVEG